MRPARTIYGGRGGGGEVTKALLAVNVLVFILTALSGAGVASGTGRSSIYDHFALVPAQVAHGQWWRIVSAMFLHYGILHIGFNMWALFVIGLPLEAMLGRVRFTALYFLSGIGGSVLSFSTGQILTPAAGASGAIFGLFGAFFVILRRRNLETGGIVGIIAINLVLSFTFANIDWRGHVGGLIVGVIVGAVMAYAPNGASRDRVQAAGCVAVAVLLVAASAIGVAHVRHECPTVVTLNGQAVGCAASQ